MNTDVDSNNIKYNDIELNSLSYEEALKSDKRTYFQSYISLLKNNHLFLFSFYPNNDYNSRTIKMFLYFYFFSLDLTINALFFTDETIHQIYEDKGYFNFIYQIPQIIYSSILSLILSSIINFLSLTEENVEKLKEEKRTNLEDFNKSIKKFIKRIKIKFILFFIITFIILSFFLFYVSCFCGVYKNTQIYLIKDTLISFATSQVYSVFTLLFPPLFRKFALKAANKDQHYLYKIGQLLENI